ncbi:TetR/AcrR family transcriptional regulator [Kurthia gibsonii]|uniref:TetR/AcrR family transcriptional regulator n=1 Tax=Kurthia gibsonii TaxID=33946 RepID=UPI002DBB34F5|nr:TetR/AcrR family transcriptional regulator [Kurthia gibsonii]MEB6112369.1 TetR/AcrR family transcriptional regulator [Kurthia gibsonii]
MDRRIIKTKMEIKQAFFHLLEQKHFENITVRDITEVANINRGTFYLHFEDKYQLMEYYEQEIFQVIQQNFQRVFLEIGLANLQCSHAEQLNQLLNSFKQQQHELRLLLGANGDPLFKEKIRQLFVANIRAYIEKNIGVEHLKYPLEYILTYVSNAHIGVIVQWLNNGLKEDGLLIAQMLLEIMLHGPFEASGIKESLNIISKD